MDFCLQRTFWFKKKNFPLLTTNVRSPPWPSSPTGLEGFSSDSPTLPHLDGRDKFHTGRVSFYFINCWFALKLSLTFFRANQPGYFKTRPIFQKTPNPKSPWKYAPWPLLPRHSSSKSNLNILNLVFFSIPPTQIPQPIIQHITPNTSSSKSNLHQFNFDQISSFDQLAVPWLSWITFCFLQLVTCFCWWCNCYTIFFCGENFWQKS